MIKIIFKLMSAYISPLYFDKSCEFNMILARPIVPQQNINLTIEIYPISFYKKFYNSFFKIPRAIYI